MFFCKKNKQWVCFVSLVLFGSVQAAAAEIGRSYAVVSLIGDRLDIVSAVRVTGSNLDRNQHDIIPMPDFTMDNAALKSAEDAILKHTPSTKVALLRINEPRLYEFQDQAMDSDGEESLLKQVIATAKGAEVSHVILISKFRGDARLRTARGYKGHGKLKGLGFYVDRNERLTRSDTGESALGFLAPYCYIKADLVDVQSATSLGSVRVAYGTTFSGARAKDSLNPWDMWSAKEQMVYMERMVKTQTGELISRLLNP